MLFFTLSHIIILSLLFYWKKHEEFDLVILFGSFVGVFTVFMAIGEICAHPWLFE